MASQFQTSSISNLANSSAVSLTKPTGTVDGDLLITFICGNGTVAPSSVPSGWTLIRSSDSGGTTTQASIHSYYKVASSEGSSYSWTAGSSIAGGMVLRVTGQESTPIDAHTGTGNQGANAWSNDISAYSTTISQARVNELVIMAAVVYNQDIGTPSLSDWKMATNNPTWTELYDNALNSGGANNWVMGCAYATRESSGATGDLTFDYNSGGERYAAQTMFVTNLNAQTFTETVTCTDTGTTNNVGFNLTVADTVTPSDTVTAEKQKTWATQDKSSTTWTNQDKS